MVLRAERTALGHRKQTFRSSTRQQALRCRPAIKETRPCSGVCVRRPCHAQLGHTGDAARPGNEQGVAITRAGDWSPSALLSAMNFRIPLLPCRQTQTRPNRKLTAAFPYQEFSQGLLVIPIRSCSLQSCRLPRAGAVLQVVAPACLQALPPAHGALSGSDTETAQGVSRLATDSSRWRHCAQAPEGRQACACQWALACSPPPWPVLLTHQAFPSCSAQTFLREDDISDIQAEYEGPGAGLGGRLALQRAAAGGSGTTAVLPPLSTPRPLRTAT